MIEGQVNARREAIVAVEVIAPITGHREIIQAVVDTGFDDFLTLPIDIIARLGLAATFPLSIQLADGSIVSTLFFEADVDWHGSRLPIEVQLAPGTPLLGMRLLDGSRLTIIVRENGSVQIEPER